MPRIAVQLYTLRDLDHPLPELLARVGETEFDGVELAGFGETKPSAVSETLGTTGLAVAGAHVDIDSLTELFEETVSRYRQAGCETLVVPYLGEARFESHEAIERTADELAALADRLAEAGVSLHYHNHDHEFTAVGGRTAFGVLAERTTQMKFELDIGWVAAAGHDPVTLLDELGDRISLVHVKDVRTESRTPVELGDGDVDIQGCVAAARRANVEWLVYEHDRPSDPLQSLKHGGERLRKLQRDAAES